MTITPTPIATNGFSTFNDALYQLLKPLEGDIPFVYADQKGIPTLGIGYALIVYNKTTGKWALRDYSADLLAANINLTQTQLDDLKAKLTLAMNALNGDASAVNPFSPAADKINPLGWTIDATQSTDLLTFIVPEYETRVKNWLGNDALYTSLQGSMEMAALVSMSFNGAINKGTFPSLKAAVLSGDRAEAWYQIRYKSNGGTTDLAYRRYAEAAVFNLYPTDASGNTVMNVDVARATYQMFTLHHDKMLAYDAKPTHQDALITAWNMLRYFPTANPESLEKELSQACVTLLADLATGIASTPNADVAVAYARWANTGDNLTTFNPTDLYLDPNTGAAHSYVLDASKDYAGNASTRNSILIGGAADTNNLTGGDGNDLLIGGDGKDELKGGKGDDYMAGGKGNELDNTLRGNDGNNTLTGGAGDDFIDGGAANDSSYTTSFEGRTA